jgi:hypothetical protein
MDSISRNHKILSLELYSTRATTQNVWDLLITFFFEAPCIYNICSIYGKINMSEGGGGGEMLIEATTFATILCTTSQRLFKLFTLIGMHIYHSKNSALVHFICIFYIEKSALCGAH